MTAITVQLPKDSSFISQTEVQAFIQEHAALCKSVSSGEAEYADNLGWLEPDEWASDDRLVEMQTLADGIRSDADAFVVVGVGGSNQASRAAISAMPGREAPEILFMGNTLSAWTLQQTLRRLDEKKSVYVNVIAKNFSTLEPHTGYLMLRAYLKNRYGADADRRIIVTGTRGSGFESLAVDRGHVFIEFPLNVGGRFTALTAVNLLPMAVAGLDIERMVKAAKAFRSACMSLPLVDNPICRYAAARSILYEKGFCVELMSYFEPRMMRFAKWWVQLFGESEGKEEKGLFPSYSEMSEDLHSVGQYIQQGSRILFETFLDIEDGGEKLPLLDDEGDSLNGCEMDELNRIAFRAVYRAHAQRLPCLKVTIPQIDEASFGQLFYLFFEACYLSARFLGVNPFDQPGVENYKRFMNESLPGGRTV